MSECFADLYWIPVGAGTPRAQRASLWLWEGFEAVRARRPRATLLHSAMKLTLDGVAYTLELTPAFIKSDTDPLVTGPVGFRGADRWTLFRYALRCEAVERLPDEQWAIGEPLRLSDDPAAVRRILELGPAVPKYVWGRRARGTPEMWTSDSVVSWLLVKAGIDLSTTGPPPGGRAPGWFAGIAVAARGEM